MGDSDDSKKTIDPIDSHSGVASWFDWADKKVTGMLGLWIGNPDATNTLTEGLKKQCDTHEERINKRKNLIESLNECSIKKDLLNNIDDVSGRLNKEIVTIDRDLKNYKCVYQHGETLKTLLGEKKHLDLKEGVDEKRSAIHQYKQGVKNRIIYCSPLVQTTY
jgi:hypothetical protein